MSSKRDGSPSPSGQNVPGQGRYLLRPRRRDVGKLTPQERIDDFWPKTPGKATSIVPQKAYSSKAGRGLPLGAASYEEAAAQCRAKVDRIITECRDVNQKYSDPHFDLERDLRSGMDDCLTGLHNIYGPAPLGSEDGTVRSRPGAVKRVADIFDKPQFYVEGPTAGGVRQGETSDCWLLAALCTMGNKAGLIERVCVARDEAVGVYGFVFHRDGEWINEVIDDKLYLKRPDYENSNAERDLFDDGMWMKSEETYRKLCQSNSGALFFAQCENGNETWLPLLEKAYAKAHGDYAAIGGGHTGEGIEDLTGGVTSEVHTTDILDKERFWREEMLRVNESFLFGCSTGARGGRGRAVGDGIIARHAYSVMRAVEMDGVRLVLLKNPWGCDEWKGPWSDGSREWTATWIEKLGHRFGDDGAFWMSYGDLLRKYQVFDRTRLFDADWRRAGAWTTMTVPWTPEYSTSRFAFSLARRGPVVLVLSQLDDRYFRGLEGQYRYRLGFRLHRRSDGGYVVRSQTVYRTQRSTSVELTLDAGSYLVLVKIDASRNEAVMPAEEVIREHARGRRKKLMRIGHAYDVAHSKGRIVASVSEESARRAAAARRRHKDKMELKEAIMQDRRLEHMERRLEHRKERRREKRREARQAAGEKADAGKKAGSSAVETTSKETKSVGGVPAVGELGGIKMEVEEFGGIKKEVEEFGGIKKEVEEWGGIKKEVEEWGGIKKEVEEWGGMKTKKAKTEKERTENPHGNNAPASTRGRRQPPGRRAATRSPSPGPKSDSPSSLSDMSDGELEMRFQMQQRNRALGRPGQPQPQPQPELQRPRQRDGSDEQDPWNAVAVVVGLRVFYQKVDGDGDGDEILKLWINRPNLFARESDEGEGAGDQKATRKHTRKGTRKDAGKDAGKDNILGLDNCHARRC